MAKLDLDRLKVKIMKDQAFFGALLHNVKWSLTDQIPTAGITVKNAIMVNPKYAETLTEDQQIAMGCHEIFHGALIHHPRIMRYPDPEDQRLANHAADFLINFMIKECGMTLGDGWLYNKDYTPDKYTMETLMEHLRKSGYSAHKRPKGQPGSGGPGNEQGTGAGDGDDILDDGQGGRTPAEQREQELNMRLGLASAVQIAKKRGNVPGVIERFVNEVLKPQQNWKEELREWFNVKLKDLVTWNRPNRRFVCQGKYFPTKYSEGCGHIGVAIDVSGSISQKELAVFESELNHIFELCRPTKVTIIYFDTRVHGPDIFEEFPIQLRSPGGGGTDFSVAFDWFNKNTDDITGLVFMTDMYCEWPEAPKYPVCVLSTTPKMEAPFGKTIYADLKNS